MARPKTPKAELVTIEDASRALHDLLLAEVELEKHQGQMDLARAAATSGFEKSIDKSKERVADLTLQLQTFYMAHHAELEKGGAKSVTLLYGVMGRRLGHPVLKPLNRSWTWAAIAVKLRELYRARFFHPPPEPKPDKEKLRAELNEADLKTVGLKVDQEENFFVETDRTALGI